MKKCLSLLLVLCLCLGLLPTAALAAEEEFVIDSLGSLRKYNGPGGDVVIPDGVTLISHEVFKDCTNLTSVTIPDGVTRIYSRAFQNCTNLTSVTIPGSVTWIGECVFEGCTSLSDVTIGNGITSTGYATFWKCTALTHVTIPDSVTTIEGMAFSRCTGLTSIAIPNSVTTIGESAFYGCAGLTDVTIPNSVKEIGNDAFAHCTGLTRVTIPDSVTSIGQRTFQGCTNLTRVTIPDSVTEIGEGAFNECTRLTSVTIPDSVTYIGNGAFDGCRDLGTATVPGPAEVGYQAFPSRTSITWVGHHLDIKQDELLLYGGPGGNIVIPDGVTSIGEGAFAGCSNVTSVTIPDSVTKIDNDAFRGCTGLTGITIPSSVTSISDGAFRGCAGLTDVTIPDRVTSIGQRAFAGCTGLTSVTIPDSVTSIDGYAFSGCTGLTNVTIPNSVTKIGENAFRGCTGLTGVTIPDSVTSIGEKAFDGCTSLAAVSVPSTTKVAYGAFPSTTKVTWVGHNFTIKNGVLTGYNGPEGNITIPDSVTSIGQRAFSSCTGLTGVTIPSSVTSVGQWAFSSCTGLTSVTIPSSVTKIDKGAFSSCTALATAFVPTTTQVASDAFPSTTKVTLVGHIFDVQDGVLKGYKGPGGDIVIPDGVTAIEGGFAGRTDITGVTIPSGVTEISDYAFSNCTALSRVTLPNTVTKIDTYAFRNCAALTGITIPNSVTTIGNNAFSGCTNLKAVTVPSTVQVASNAFPSTTKVTLAGHYFDVQNGVLKSYRGPGGAVTIPSNVTSIGDYAFRSCTALTGITIPNTVTSIGYQAFQGCTGLTGLTVPSSVTSIGEHAFEGCAALTAVSVPSTTKVAYNAFPSATKVTLVGHYFDVQNGVLKGYKGPGGAVTVPNTVTSIGNNAFQNCKVLTAITIPNTVTAIGENAFYGCTGLTGVTIPASVTSLGGFAFRGCTALKSVTIPGSVTEIGSQAFYQCTGLTSVIIPKGVTTIGYSAFQDCSGLTAVTIPDSVTEIGSYAFSGCTKLTAVSVPSTANIGSNAFPSTTKVTLVGHNFTVKNGILTGYNGPAGNVPIPEGVTEIAGGFAGRTDITGVTIPSSVIKIGDSVFKGCTALTQVNLPGSVITIGSSAFENCTGLTAVTFGSGVAEIGSKAFSGCTRLAAAAVPSAAQLGYNAFPSTTKVTLVGHNFTVQNGVLTGYKGPGGDLMIPGNVTAITGGFSDRGDITSVTIPSGVTKIGSRAFENCTGLVSVTIPESVTVIEGGAFSGCTALKSVALPSATQLGYNTFPDTTKVTRVGHYFDVKNGVLQQYIGPGGDLVIPNGVTSIAYNAFASNRTNITSVTIPDSVTALNSCFAGCTGLISVTVGNGVTSLDGTFERCTGLTRLTLGNRVATIGGNAFSGCTGLTGVTIPASVTSIGYSAFQGCTGLTGLVIPNSVTKIGGSAFSGCTGLTSVTLGSGLTELGGDAFRGCTGLKSITIPGSVTRLNSGTLDGCTGLTSLTVSHGVKEVSLGHGDAPNVKALSLPDSVEKLSISSSTLRELVIPAGVTSWPNLNCPRLTKLTFPKDNWVFKGISRANFMKNISNLTALNTIVNCPNEFVDDLVVPNAAIRSNWTNPKSTVVAQSARITQLSREITAGCTTDYDKAKAISQWVVDHIKYDDDYYYEGLKNYSDVPFDPEEILDKGNAVCAGYARLTQALLVAQNIPCLYVLGWVSGGYHAWNLAYLDGEYLWIDNTWGMDYFGQGIYKFSNDHKATGAASFNGVKGPGTLVQGEPLDAENMEKTSIGTALPETAEEILARETIEALKSQYPDGMSWTNANSYYSEGLKSTGNGCAGFAYICSDAVFGKAPAAETHSSFDKIRVGDILRINNDTHSVVVLRKMSDGVIVAEGNYNSMIHWDRQISKAELESGGLKVTTRWGTKAPEENAVNSVLPSATGMAYPSTQTVAVDGKSVSFQCYSLKDAAGNDTNYIKLRDLADILNSTNAKFQVGWDGSVTITAGQGYTKNGSEQKTPFSGQRSYVRASAPTYVNGARASLSAFVLNDDQGGGYTYYQLRDLGQALNFNVSWSAERGIYLETDKPYDANN